MTKLIHYITLSILSIIFIYFIGILFGYWAIVKANSNSLENGYYFVWFSNQVKIKHNDYIAICIPNEKYATLALQHGLAFNTHYCKTSKAAPLIKKVKAIIGNKVIINNYGVYVDGVYIANSKPQNSLPNTYVNQKLEANEFIVMGSNSQSFDSRYFGVIKRTGIIGKGYLLWKI